VLLPDCFKLSVPFVLVPEEEKETSSIESGKLIPKKNFKAFLGALKFKAFLGTFKI
jgi:hypothetical protein